MSENRCSNCAKRSETRTRLYGYGNLDGTKICYEERIVGKDLECINFVASSGDDEKSLSGLVEE